MDTAIIITTIVSAAASVSISVFIKETIMSVKSTMLKAKIMKMTIRLIAKYTAMAIVACAIFLLMPSGKLFVFTVFMLIIIISINITRDYIHWTLMTFIFEKHKFKAKEKEDSVLQSLSASSKQGARIVEVYKKEREKDEKWLHDL